MIDWKTVYDGGNCPDCGTPIPRNEVEGNSCRNCHHVFWLPPGKYRVLYSTEFEKEITAPAQSQNVTDCVCNLKPGEGLCKGFKVHLIQAVDAE